jgi:hypothetical protein
MTAADDDAVTQVIAGERALLTPAVRTCAAALDRLLDPEFTEIGRSGRLWTRAEILAELPALAAAGTAIRDASGPAAPVRDAEMTGRRLADDLVLLTFITEVPGRRARRTSLWRRSGGTWRVLHHQGTPLA